MSMSIFSRGGIRPGSVLGLVGLVAVCGSCRNILGIWPDLGTPACLLVLERTTPIQTVFFFSFFVVLLHCRQRPSRPHAVAADPFPRVTAAPHYASPVLPAPPRSLLSAPPPSPAPTPLLPSLGDILVLTRAFSSLSSLHPFLCLLLASFPPSFGLEVWAMAGELVKTARNRFGRQYEIE